MRKWYEAGGMEDDIVVVSRIRLLRNLKGYKFPARLSADEKKELNQFIGKALEVLPARFGQTFESCTLDEFSDIHKMALKERHVINQSALDSDSSIGVTLSADESISITTNANDHIRILVSRSGLDLEEALKDANKVDDAINETFEYAFDEKLGYMTAFPTNMGTGLHAYLILHLPLLSSSRKFRVLLDGISRYGVAVKGAFEAGNDNPGSLFVLYNQKTLGVSEKDIVQVLTKVAGQLASQERAVRKYSVEAHRDEIEDCIYRSYGILKYARTITFKDAMNYLSQLRWGMEMNLLPVEEMIPCYQLMLGVQPANLQVLYDKPMKQEELDRVRASYLRQFLPPLEPET